MSKSKGKNKILKADGSKYEKPKPEIMLARPIARVPMWENQLKFQQAFFELSGRGYKLEWEDLESINWWLKHHSSSRNNAAYSLLQRPNCEYLVWVDDDMTFMNLADDIEKMIELDKDIVIGITSCKPVPHFPNLGKVTELGKSGAICDCVSRHIYDFPKDKPFEVDFGSMGLCCVKRKVYEKMPRPWFYFPPNYSTGNVWGEDVTFMFNAKMYGFEIWCDPTILCGHLGYTAWHYEQRTTHWLDFKDKLIKQAKDEGWDCTHNLEPEVQKIFKKGKGPKQMFV